MQHRPAVLPSCSSLSVRSTKIIAFSRYLGISYEAKRTQNFKKTRDMELRSLYYFCEYAGFFTMKIECFGMVIPLKKRKWF